MSEAPSFRIAGPSPLDDPALRPILAALPEARLVGGSVRDALAARPVADLDLATPRRPEAVIAALRAAAIRTVPTGLDHGTVTAIVGVRGVEITTLRRDVETDGRHARIAYTDDWRADAARRDFTINAMSMRPDGAVFDYFGGAVDLREGRVRFVGEAARRIAEDYLRILRFFRFQASYGRDEPDRAAVAAIRAAADGLLILSAERVWSELQRILAAPDPARVVGLMAELGVLERVLAEGADPDRHARLIAIGAPADPLLRLAALLRGDAIALADRLRLSSAERTRLALLRAGPCPDPGASDAALRRLLAEYPREILIGRAWLAQSAWGQGAGAAGQGEAWAGLRERLARMAVPRFPLEGRDALALGEPSGPRVGALLRQVREYWLAGGCVADRAACLAELARRRGG